MWMIRVTLPVIRADRVSKDAKEGGRKITFSVHFIWLDLLDINTQSFFGSLCLLPLTVSINEFSGRVGKRNWEGYMTFSQRVSPGLQGPPDLNWSCCSHWIGSSPPSSRPSYFSLPSYPIETFLEWILKICSKWLPSLFAIWISMTENAIK